MKHVCGKPAHRARPPFNMSQLFTDVYHMDPALWPCRSVAEYAYCPRLFYLMTVEGIFLPSADTERGVGVHRLVNQPSAAIPCVDKPEQVEKLENDEEDKERPRSIRSLALTSRRLGLTGTLDLAEVDGTRAVPVEYRKGRPRHDALTGGEANDEMLEAPKLLHAPEPWPTDRVQLGLEVLLLEEAGYSVPEAYLYYAAEKLRLLVPVDDALRNEAIGALEAAKLTAQAHGPARCSMIQSAPGVRSSRFACRMKSIISGCGAARLKSGLENSGRSAMTAFTWSFSVRVFESVFAGNP